jgi:hypothetical protein
MNPKKKSLCTTHTVPMQHKQQWRKGDSSLNILVKVISIITTVTTEITLRQGPTTTLKIIADHHPLQNSTWRIRIINNSNSSSLLRMKLNKDPRLQRPSQQPQATRNNNITSSRSIQLKTKILDTRLNLTVKTSSLTQIIRAEWEAIEKSFIPVNMYYLP